ncbi:uncharacterized protein J8A68_001396 [[Candida] subhashii]|uniref:Uncharacterized protein n=1 Tax=[Candida] subhashii TaxID=561895 RepID=A0A8J5US35_9ASCO|nr:uncharacterized protein J8A68_001396 [[Candida] subhashii]KAG7665087.1 hypothetical protein J8A68_001396 [[Candida] subhashii]
MFIGKRRGAQPPKKPKEPSESPPITSSSTPSSSDHSTARGEGGGTTDKVLQSTPPEYKRTFRSKSKSPWKEKDRKSNSKDRNTNSKDRNTNSKDNNGNTKKKTYTPPHRLKQKQIKESPGKSEEELSILAKRQARFATPPTPSKHEHGFVSRGESYLQNNEEAQQELFSEIIADFINYCNSNSTSVLQKEFNKVVTENDMKSAESVEKDTTTPQKITIDSILLQTRKLREALLYSTPNEFCKRVFFFSLRIAAIVGDFRTYIPSILYLLENREELQLSTDEIEEVATLLILHHIHKTEEISKAVRLYFEYIPKKSMIFDMIRSWIDDDWYRWFRIYELQSDSSMTSMMAMGLTRMIKLFIDQFNQTYYTIAKSELERLLPSGIKVDDLIEKYGADWKLKDDMVIIRERRAIRSQ